MKLILAIIQPSKLEAVKDALSKVAVFRMTIVDLQGFGRQKGRTEVCRGRTDQARFSFEKYLHNRQHGIGSIYGVDSVKQYPSKSKQAV